MKELPKMDCRCSSITLLLHDLVQSAQIIQMYASSYKARIKTGNVNNEQIADALHVIHNAIQDITNKIHAFAELK